MNKFIFYFLIFILLLPVIEYNIQISGCKPLSGAYIPKPDIKLSVNKWFSSEYQNTKEEYIKDNLGFKPFFVRSYNQLTYSLFKIANNPQGIVGKDNYLYLTEYIYNQTGQNYIGDEAINKKVQNLKYLQNFFKAKNITLLTAFLPSKASFYPEYIPDYFKKYPKSNYSAFIEAYDSLGLNYIDLNKYFLEIKDTTSIPLFPKNGLHWTSYGMAIGMDTLIKTIEHYKNIDLPDFSWKKPIKLSAENHKPDFDEEELMNLLFELPREKMPYPEFVYNSKNKTKPKTLVICDSYYWQPYEQYVHHNVFDFGGFWFYFNTARQVENNKETVTPVDSIDLVTKLLDQDVIVLFASQATLHLFPYDFDSKAKFIFMPHDSISLSNYYTKLLERTSESIKIIKQKAESNGISYEKQLRLDVQYMAEAYMDKYYHRENEIEKLIEEIKNNKTMLEYIKEKAKKRGNSVDKMIKLDAEWVVDNKNN